MKSYPLKPVGPVRELREVSTAAHNHPEHAPDQELWALDSPQISYRMMNVAKSTTPGNPTYEDRSTASSELMRRVRIPIWSA